MARLVFGRVFVKRNGKQVLAKGGFRVQPGNDEVDASLTLDGAAQVLKRTPVPGMVEGKAIFDPDTYGDITSTDPATISIEIGETGTWVGEAAEFIGDGAIDAESGEFDVKWSCVKLQLVK